MKKYDIIIAGAGPAGLLLGLELSKKYSILILEENTVNFTNKSWLTYKDRWKQNNFPIKFITNEFKTWNFTINNSHLTIKDRYICINEEKFLTYLKTEIEKNGSTILEYNKFEKYEYNFLKISNPINYTRTNFSERPYDSIIINNEFQSRLLIDCCGINSPILKQNNNLITTPIYINCYGYIGEFENLENSNYYTMYDEDNMPNISCFGVTKISKNKAFILFLTYDKEISDFKNYDKRLQFALLKHNVPKHKVIEKKIVSYPTCELSAHSFDHILMFGDSASLSPAFSGMGFNEILRQYKHVANHISLCFTADTLDAKNLCTTNLAQNINNLLFEVFGILVLIADSNLMASLMDAVAFLTPKQMKHIMRNELSEYEIALLVKELLNHPDIVSFIKKLDFHTIKQLLHLIPKISSTIVAKNIHNFIFAHHKIKLHDIYKE